MGLLGKLSILLWVLQECLNIRERMNVRQVFTPIDLRFFCYGQMQMDKRILLLKLLIRAVCQL